ncbi:MAG: hypothetical protein V2A58_11725 [Planctomycetota bacterium]
MRPEQTSSQPKGAETTRTRPTRVQPAAAWRVRMELAPAVHGNPLGLMLPKRSVRERFRLTFAAVQDIISKMAARHGGVHTVRVEPVVRGGMVVELEVSSPHPNTELVAVLESLRAYLTHGTSGGTDLFDCGGDEEGFIQLVRERVPATVVARREGFTLRYSTAGGRIFVKDLVALPEDEPQRFRELLVGKTMFRDYEPERFSEQDLDGLFDGLDRFYGVLRESLEEVLKGRKAKPRPEADDEDPWEKAISLMGGMASSAVVVQWVEKEGDQEFAETMTFHDRKGLILHTSAFSESEFTEEGNVSRWRSLLDVHGFLAENRERLWFIAVRTTGRDGKKLGTLYMREVKALESWEKQKLDGLAYLPLYEFFSNYGLAELAAQTYEGYGVEIDVSRSAAVISVLGKWEPREKEVTQALRSLGHVSGGLLVVDMRYATPASTLVRIVKQGLEGAAGTSRETRIVANPHSDAKLGEELGSLFPAAGVFPSIEEALREPPRGFSQDPREGS